MDENQRLKLILMRKKYQFEILNGDKRNIKNLIATTVILSNKYFTWDLVDSTLQDFIYPFCEKPATFRFLIPTEKDLKELKNIYRNVRNNSIDDNYRLVSLVWMDSMLKYGLVKEGEAIYIDNIKLSDFITDESIIEMYKENNNILVKKHN